MQSVDKTILKDLPSFDINIIPGMHLAFLYEDEVQHQAVLTAFLRQGLERHEKVLYLHSTPKSDAILEYASVAGVDVEPYLESGQLVFKEISEACVPQRGEFSEGLAWLYLQTMRAVADGYVAVRVSIEQTPALSCVGCNLENAVQLREFFSQAPCSILCQYDRRIFSPPMLLDVLRAHPTAIVGTALCDNFYYIALEQVAEETLEAAELRNWLRNLLLYHSTQRPFADVVSQTQNLLDTDEYTRCETLTYAADGIVLADEQGQIVEWNHSMERISGIGRAEVLNRPFWEIMFRLLPRLNNGPSPIQRLQDSFLEFQETGQASWINRLTEVHLKREGGGQCIVQSLAFTIPTKKGFWVGYINRDVTEQKALAIKPTQVEKSSATDELIALLAHNLNNPLQSALGCLSLANEALSDRPSQDVSRYLKVAYQEVRRIARVIAQMTYASEFVIDTSGIVQEGDNGQ